MSKVTYQFFQVVDDAVVPALLDEPLEGGGNTLFPTAEAAWKHLLSDATAGVKLAGSSVKSAAEHTARAHAEAAFAAVRFVTVNRRWEKFRCP